MTRPGPNQPRLDGSTPAGGVRRHLDQTIGALRQTGRLEAVDAGLVAMVRTAADAIDDEVAKVERSTFTIATSLRTLHALYGDLRALAGVEHDDLDDLLAALSPTTGDAAPS